MFTNKSSALMLVLTLSVLPVAGFAQNASGGEATASAETGHQNWKNMTPEQREQAKAARKAKWQAMSPAEKEAKKAEMKAKFDSLPPEKQAEIKARREQRKETRHNGGASTTTAPAAK
jgi:hypothetical protein